LAAKILTTFAIGQRYEALWNTYCKASWEHFAARHGYELVVINKMLRADSRSPAWQKLALPEYFSNAEQVLFVDADIIFSSGAFDPLPLLQEGCVGVVPEPRGPNYRRSVRLWAGKNHIMSAQEYYQRTAQIDSPADIVYNTGVMAFRPNVAKELFERVWRDYKETIYYEQPALSHELVTTGLVQTLPEDFNTNWSIDRMAFPFFTKLDQIRTNRKNPLHHIAPIRKLLCEIRFGCILERLSRCSFLHLSGGQFSDIPRDWWQRHLEFEKAGEISL
jgi:hypothetical protein